MKRKVICLILSVCSCLSLASCGTPTTLKNKYSTQSFDYFDTVSIITGYEETQEDFDAVADDVLSQLSEYHKLYSIYHRFAGMENLCTINELVDGQHRTVTVDKRIIDMLQYAIEMYEETDGMLNIAMGSVLSLWHDYRTIGKDDPSTASLPPSEKLSEAAKHTDISAIVIDEANSTVTLTDPAMKLDVGAIAKGYATEQIAKYLEEKGISGYVLNIGGNVRTIGPKADGEKWTVGIEDGNGGDYLAYLALSGQSVVTSGSYQRYYIVDGKKYHHIIHPDTLMPAEGYLSVSVVTTDSGMADALSTALFCMSQEQGIQLIEALADTEAMWVSDNGDIAVSSGWEALIKN